MVALASVLQWAFVPLQALGDWRFWPQIVFIVVWALLLAVVVLVLVRVLLLPFLEEFGIGDEPESGMERLKERFASGEIDQDEFERRAVTLALRDVGDVDDAMATLQDRFARGEIDEEEYHRRAAVLTGRSEED